MDLKPSKDNELVELYTQRFSSAMDKSKAFRKRLKKYKTLSTADLETLLDDIIKMSQQLEEASQCMKSAGCIELLLKIVESSANEGVLDKASTAGASTKEFNFPWSDTKISIREPSFAEADLGWKTWFSSIIMSRFLSEGRIDVKGKDLIELGCGTAIVGIMAAKHGASSVLMTDYHDKVVHNARYNVELNHCNLETTKVEQLDWRDILQLKKEGKTESIVQFETVLAADVIYDDYHPDLIPNVLSCISKRSPSSIIYLVIPQRERFGALIKGFEAEMTSLGFEQLHREVIEKIVGDPNGLEYMDVPHLYYIYKWKL